MQALKDKHILTIDGEFPLACPCPYGALCPLSPTYLHKILELLLMYLVSLSQPHNAASNLELSQSLEFKHKVQRKVTL
jgi:Sister chromatid cohesion protein Dcc1